MNLLFRLVKNKLFILVFISTLILLASLFITNTKTKKVTKQIMVADISTQTVNTSTVATATRSSAQRKSFYDSVNNLYWVFY
jgi:hypothetical protein